jgi:hypothetical protein
MNRYDIILGKPAPVLDSVTLEPMKRPRRSKQIAMRRCTIEILDDAIACAAFPSWRGVSKKKLLKARQKLIDNTRYIQQLTRRKNAARSLRSL